MNLINRKAYNTLCVINSGIRAPSLIAEDTEYSYKTTLKTLKTLKDMGLIKDVENHRYEITFLGVTVHKLMGELINLERFGN